MVIRVLEIVPVPHPRPGVEDRHGEGVPGGLELVRPMAVEGASLLQPRVRCLFGLEVIVPIAEPVMRISAIVPDQAPGEAPQDRLGVAVTLQVRADGAQLVLELEEVRDVRYMLAASLAALGGGPSVVPLDRAIYLPVGPHEPRRQTRFAIGLREAVDAPADLGLAAIQCKWAAH